MVCKYTFFLIFENKNKKRLEKILFPCVTMFTGLHAYWLTGLLARGWQVYGKGLARIWQVYGKLNQGFGLGKFLATTV